MVPETPKPRARPRLLRRDSRRASVHRIPTLVEDQVFHPLVGIFLAGLAEKHHQHHPLELLDVDVVRLEREQPVDHDLALRGREDAEVLEVQQVAAHVGVEPHLLRAAEHSHRAGRALAERALGIGREALEPEQRALDLRLRVARLLELGLERLAVRHRIVLGIQEVLEQVDQDVEHGVLHRACLAVVRPYRPPARDSTRPSSSSNCSFEITDGAAIPVRSTSRSRSAGSKPSAFNSISASLSNGPSGNFPASLPFSPDSGALESAETPRTASTSSTVSTSAAPSLMRRWQPRARGLCMEPGIAITSRPCSAPCRAVMREPERA